MRPGGDIAARELLRALFDAALAAADPARAIPPYLPAPAVGRTVVVGAGKASAAMAQAFEEAWLAKQKRARPLEGLVVTRHGHAVPCEHIRIVEAGHPVPDRAGEEAAHQILELARGLGPDDQLVCLVSGGGSALLTLPAPGLTLADKQAVTQALLRCGATIGEINTVRKHLSAIKGGRLAAAAAPARVVSLAISECRATTPRSSALGRRCPTPRHSPMRARCSRNTASMSRARSSRTSMARLTKRRSRAIRFSRTHATN